ncbi:MAG: hypothetical protein Kow0047_13660 [Anaerolineae bacterium]
MKRVETQLLLGLMLVLITATILIAVGIGEERRMEEATRAEEAEAIEVGAQLFDTNCKGCHGPKGEGILGLAPPLNDAYFFTKRLEDVGWQGSMEDFIIATISMGRPVSTRPDLYPGGGRPAMPAWAQRYGGPLRDDEVRNIARFILNWEKTATGEVALQELPTPTPSAAESADPVARGRQIFTAIGCAGCHTIEGISAGVAGPNLTHIGTTAAEREPGKTVEDYLRESIVAPNNYVVEGFQPNIMPQTYGQQLSEQELADLIAFLSAQK